MMLQSMIQSLGLHNVAIDRTNGKQEINGSAAMGANGNYNDTIENMREMKSRSF